MNNSMSMNLESQNIIKFLADAIVNDVYTSGSLLPKETELAEKFDTGRANANYAFKCLEEYGIVTRKKRQGTILFRKPSLMEFRKLLHPYCNQIDVLASLNRGFASIHWNSATLSNLEKRVNRDDYQVYYHDLHTLNSRELLEEYLKTKIGLDSYALVILPVHRYECSLIIDNYDLFLHYHSNVYLLDNGTVPTYNWPFHRISQSAFHEGLCAASHLIKFAEKKVSYCDPRTYDGGFFVEERMRGFSQGLAQAGSFELKTIDFNMLSKAYLEQNDIRLIVAPHCGGAVEIFDKLSQEGVVAGVDYGLISLDNDMNYQQYNISSVVAPLDKYGELLGDLICDDHFGKNLGNKISIEVTPTLIERKTYNRDFRDKK